MDSGFVPLRRGLMEHLERGKMSLAEVASYVIILMKADFHSGTWRAGSAAAIHVLSGRTITERQARRALEGLEDSGYIKRFPITGAHRNYPIQVLRYGADSQGRAGGEEMTALNSYGSSTYVESEGSQGRAGGEEVTSSKEIRNKNIHKQLGKPLAFETQEIRITVDQDASLREAFPWVDRMSEYRKMASWLAANPIRKKSNFHRFAHNWMSRIPRPQDRRDVGLDIPLAVPEFDPRLLKNKI